MKTKTEATETSATDSNKKSKRKYVKPEIQSEKLNSYGALCNGTTGGGRKASTTAPAFCSATKRNS